MKASGTYPRSTNLLLVPAIALLFLIFPSQPGHEHSAQQVSPAPGLKVTVKRQDDSPLIVSFVNHENVNGLQLEMSLSVKNVGKLPVRSYAIRYLLGPGNRGGGTELGMKLSPKSSLQPGASESKTIGVSDDPIGNIDNILLSVDFVEFIDGTTWGENIQTYKDQVEGLRAGARAATKQLSRMLESEGAYRLLGALEENQFSITPPADRSTEWQKGFRSGVNLITGRLRYTYQKHGINDVENLLTRPYESWESR
jgi:hypothetical protein